MRRKTILLQMAMLLHGSILALVCLFAGNAKAQTRFNYFLLEAEKQRLAENYSAATELYSHCFRINPDAPEVLYNMAIIEHALRHDSIGNHYLKLACERDSNNMWYLGTLASYYIEERNTADVIPVLERMAKLDPKRNDVHTQLAAIYRSEEQPLKAIESLNRVEHNLGINFALTSEKVDIYNEMGDKASAYAELDALRKENPHDMNTLVQIGGIYERLEEMDKAQAIYDEVRQKDPTNESLQYALMQYYKNTGRQDEYVAIRDSILFSPRSSVRVRNAMMNMLLIEASNDSLAKQMVWPAFDTLLSRPQEDGSLYILKAIYQVSTHDSTFTEDELAETMKEALKVEPNNKLALEHMLQYYGTRNDLPALEEICRRGINYYPETMGYHYYLCIALTQQNKNIEAVETLQQGLRIKSARENALLVSDMFALKGDIEHQLKREREAFASYDSALVYNPENVGCLNNYAYFLSLRNEQLDRAEEMSYRTVRVEPKNKTYLDTYAWILFMKEDYTGARRYMERVIDPQAPEDSIMTDALVSGTVLEHAGDIYAKCGQMDEALYYWDLALRRDRTGSATLRKKLKKKKYIK